MKHKKKFQMWMCLCSHSYPVYQTFQYRWNPQGERFHCRWMLRGWETSWSLCMIEMFLSPTGLQLLSWCRELRLSDKIHRLLNIFLVRMDARPKSISKIFLLKTEREFWVHWKSFLSLYVYTAACTVNSFTAICKDLFNTIRNITFYLQRKLSKVSSNKVFLIDMKH